MKMYSYEIQTAEDAVFDGSRRRTLAESSKEAKAHLRKLIEKHSGSSPRDLAFVDEIILEPYTQTNWPITPISHTGYYAIKDDRVVGIYLHYETARQESSLVVNRQRAIEKYNHKPQ